jgi:dodecin
MAVARVTEIIAGSKKGFDDAIKEGLARANKTLKNVSGVWIKDQSIQVDKGKAVEYRVTMKITFILE